MHKIYILRILNLCSHGKRLFKLFPSTLYAFCYAQAWNLELSKHQSCYLRLQVLSHAYVLLNTLNLHSEDQSNSSVGKVLTAMPTDPSST